MEKPKYLFWNVDTQYDFVSPDGKLYVPGAERLKSNWQKLTRIAETKSISVVNTADWHHNDSGELSANPDFVTTFPPHCMANSKGADYIEETRPENPLIVNWEQNSDFSLEKIKSGEYRNIIIRKDAFDVFKGNPFTEQILNTLAPEIVIVYGVTTNVCVNDAVLGLVKRGKKVIVIEDAVKELPKIALPFEKWNELGVELKHLNKIQELFNF